MTAKRLFQIIMLNLQRGATARGRYLKKKRIFGEVGESVRYQIRTIPLYPELIRLHNNINVSSGTSFIVHDAAQAMLNELFKYDIPEKVGGIEVMDNVFIGANCTILGNVRIGKNVIIGANTLVNHDLEPNGVYAGIPAKRVGDFDDFVAKRKNSSYPTVAHNQHISEEEIQMAWKDFYESRNIDFP